MEAVDPLPAQTFEIGGMLLGGTGQRQHLDASSSALVEACPQPGGWPAPSPTASWAPVPDVPPCGRKEA